MQICFLIKIENGQIYAAKLIVLWYDNFGKNQTPLQKNVMAAIPKITKSSWQRFVHKLCKDISWRFQCEQTFHVSLENILT